MNVDINFHLFHFLYHVYILFDFLHVDGVVLGKTVDIITVYLITFMKFILKAVSK